MFIVIRIKWHFRLIHQEEITMVMHFEIVDTLRSHQSMIALNIGGIPKRLAYFITIKNYYWCVHPDEKWKTKQRVKKKI